MEAVVKMVVGKLVVLVEANRVVAGSEEEAAVTVDWEAVDWEAEATGEVNKDTMKKAVAIVAKTGVELKAEIVAAAMVA